MIAAATSPLFENPLNLVAPTNQQTPQVTATVRHVISLDFAISQPPVRLSTAQRSS